jgi:hypothetical protein
MTRWRVLLTTVAATVLLWMAPGCGPVGVDSADAAGWPDASLGSGASTLRLGPAEVSSPAGALARVTGDNTGAYGWNGPTGFERPGDATGFWPYATAGQLPDGGSGFLPWRALVPAYPADVYVPGGTTHLAIEYKDNLWAPRLDPYRPKGEGPSVRVQGVKLGELEARRDHQWKRVVLAIPAGTPREADGRYRVRLGGGTYGQNEFYGSALVHRVIAARGPIPGRTPVPGFWPKRIRHAGDGRLYDRAGRPYVPIIVSLPHGNVDLTQIDATTYIGANTNLAVGSAEGAGRRGWAPMDYRTIDTRQMGITTTMAETKARGLFAIPWNYTDTWMYFVTRVGASMVYGGQPYQELYNGTWRGVVKVWEAGLRNLVASNTNAPLVYLKDEWDHESTYWGSLEEQVRELREVANRVAPGVPTLVTAMGWKPLMHKTTWELADVIATDRYPTPTRIAEVAEWAEESRRWSIGRAFLTVLALTNSYTNVRSDPTKWNSVDYLRSGFYIGIVHGARGVWMFGDPAGMNDAAARTYYASLKPLTTELRQLTDVIHGSATELGRTIATTRLGANFYPLGYQAIGDGTSATDGVATAYRQSATRKVLLTVNEWNEWRTSRLRVSTVRAGDRITVLFENRTVTADRDGSFVDSYAPFARHVYLIPR